MSGNFPGVSSPISRSSGRFFVSPNWTIGLELININSLQVCIFPGNS